MTGPAPALPPAPVPPPAPALPPAPVPVPVPVPVPDSSGTSEASEEELLTEQTQSSNSDSSEPKANTESASELEHPTPELEPPQDLPESDPQPTAAEEAPLLSEEPEAPSEAEAPKDPTAEVPSEATGPRCPYCRESLEDVPEVHAEEERAGERPVACVECDTPVHARCAQIHGRCVSRGCRGRSFAFVDRLPRPQIRATRIVRARSPRPRAPGRAARQRQPRELPECPRDWWRRDAPLLVVGLVGILSLALFGDSLAEGARRFDEVHASLVRDAGKGK